MPLVARDELAGTGTERSALRRLSLSNKPPLPDVEGAWVRWRRGACGREGGEDMHLRRRGHISTLVWRCSWVDHAPIARLLRACDEQRGALARAR